MDPELKDLLMPLVRGALYAASGWLVTHHVWSQAPTESYINAAAVYIIAAAWTRRVVIGNKLKILVSLMHPELNTIKEVKDKIAEKKAAGEPLPSPSTPENVVPITPTK